MNYYKYSSVDQGLHINPGVDIEGGKKGKDTIVFIDSAFFQNSKVRNRMNNEKDFSRECLNGFIFLIHFPQHCSIVYLSTNY